MEELEVVGESERTEESEGVEETEGTEVIEEAEGTEGEGTEETKGVEGTDVTEETEGAGKAYVDIPEKEGEFYEMEIAVDEGKFDGNSGDIEVGKFVSFYYTGEFGGKGTPINPKIYSVRKDVTSWAQVLHDKKPKLHQRIWKPTRPIREWTMENQRKFFDDFAKEQGFDPLIAKNWYKFEKKDIDAKIGKGLLHKHNDSLIRALFAIYPEIGLDAGKFKSIPANYWANPDNRKKFFVDYAKERGFDPEIPENWYSVELSDLRKKKGSAGLTKIHKGSLKAALNATFPDIGFKNHKFAKSPTDYWKSPANQRMFFDEFSKSRNFDPLFPKNWYSVKHTDLLATKGCSTIVEQHGSLAKALISNYPNIGLEESQITRTPYAQLYDTPEKRRAFLDAFAARHKFDPKIPDNWYSVTRESVIDSKGGDGLLKQYNRNLINALMDIYPDIGLRREHFRFGKKNFFKLFRELSKLKEFDSKDPRKWYSITSKDILGIPGSKNIKTVFPTLAAALLYNFPNIGLDASKFHPSLFEELH
eukprot:Phypoly_transcript_06862.p1 GENE.Phypoly_transcript_06862~~Phypoly_transcript_06862.p1  ORF type:complete len:562 (+),score=109.53 Phypoly_transcript_06862:93-1688(+)